ncbi:GNAT family N-acetyltransferase [Streptomyces sp. NEAU-W12]|uniref:GNAT family N-acetyltransferase n=1 Tax=Streptomyces sp. NEAU-W12 TaxID=2994668 RepID=UPI00224A76DD|nr:GNAT family N-acetyltransferase [Streptomyces sp. NEAU-W12]MCX2925729.1 GNAT family N-acetyltransferase [Streptomyces sp. NEAU-W12]
MTKTTHPRLEEITSENLDAALGLRVRPDQEFAVAPVVKSLAEAYVHPGSARPRLIMDGDRAVGFLMAFLDIGWHDGGSVVRSVLWRLDGGGGTSRLERSRESGEAEEQGKGYGRFAVEAVADRIRARGGKSSAASPGPTGSEALRPAPVTPSPARSAPASSPSAASSPAAGVR